GTSVQGRGDAQLRAGLRLGLRTSAQTLEGVRRGREAEDRPGHDQDDVAGLAGYSSWRRTWRRRSPRHSGGGCHLPVLFNVEGGSHLVAAAADNPASWSPEDGSGRQEAARELRGKSRPTRWAQRGARAPT